MCIILIHKNGSYNFKVANLKIQSTKHKYMFGGYEHYNE